MQTEEERARVLAQSGPVREFRVSRVDRYQVTDWSDYRGGQTRVVGEDLSLAMANELATTYGKCYPGSLVNTMEPTADTAGVLPAVLGEADIKHMVDRFLCWKLPSNFSPDAGISFKPGFNEHTAHAGRHEPSGTNLFDATQATAMVRHLLEGLPSQAGRPQPA